MGTSEVNFDGLPGPTHNYAGLAAGNLASAANRNQIANPRLAALQGLAKMKALADRGFAQAVLPPHERPDVATLRRLGFSGSDADVVTSAARSAPEWLAACSSAAAMWTANAATVSGSTSTTDGRVHFTPANLIANFHRSLEAPTTTRILRSIFADGQRFLVHDPLPAASQLSDEGAANHMRLCSADGRPIEVFVWGREALGGSAAAPRRFRARQTREASTAIARRHGLRAADGLLVQQNADAIDHGAFHNDVVAVARDATLFCHERAFADTKQAIAELEARIGDTFRAVVIGESEVSLEQAVATYLFNSQLLRRPDGGLLLVATAECEETPTVAACIERVIGTGAIEEVVFFDLRQSMKNGGGPACVRLTVPLTEHERAATRGRIWLDDALYTDLVGWVARHYRDRLAPADLADPSLLLECRTALDELTTLLRLPPLYGFQD